MARKRRKTDRAELERLATEPPEDLKLPSLQQNRAEGHAYRYTIVLPLLTESGEEVFSVTEHIGPIVHLLTNRFGGATSSNPDHIPLLGYWSPRAGGTAKRTTDEKYDYDQNIIIRVYSRHSSSADKFIKNLKYVLKTFSYIPQQEILIEKVEVWLMQAERPGA